MLVAEHEKCQQLIYYISEVLHGPKEYYSEVHKLLCTLFMASRKLQHYF